MDLPHPGGFARMLSDDTWQLVIALHRHDTNSGEAFSESRTGLDHVGITVPSRDDLVTWQAHLETHGVLRAQAADRPLTQSPIADEPYGSVLVFRDPDNIQLELFAPPAAEK
jgi:glyoxylase I family protein